MATLQMFPQGHLKEDKKRGKDTPFSSISSKPGHWVTTRAARIWSAKDCGVNKCFYLVITTHKLAKTTIILSQSRMLIEELIESVGKGCPRSAPYPPREDRMDARRRSRVRAGQVVSSLATELPITAVLLFWAFSFCFIFPI